MIDIKLPVLVKDHEWLKHSEKLEEESQELIEDIHYLDSVQKFGQGKVDEKAAAELLSEVLDVMQVCIGVIDKLIQVYPKILAKGVVKHIEKLYSRGWKFKKWLNISED